MACSHCDAPVSASGAARYRGRLYHPHCRNCFVCGEEDLQDAETFKGVIFCGACARRIFAERARRRPRAPTSPRVHPPPRTPRTPRPRLRDLHTQTVYYANTIPVSVNVPSLDKVAALDATDMTEPADDKTLVPQHPVHVPDRYIQRETGDMPTAPELLTNKKESTEHKSTAADVGLAELGASVELVQVALRRSSVTTLVIKSGSGFNLEKNKSLTRDLKPGPSGSQATSPSGSTYQRTLQLAGGGLWRNTKLGSAVKMPFKLLKQNILDKRFIVSVHSRTEKQAPPSGLRDLFHDEISMHHRRGERVLYTTINRRSKPHKLGWVSAATGTKNKRCRHYRGHSYRCLRAHVMRRAGPTRSDLHQFRGKIKKLVTGQFVGRLLREANLTNVRAG